MKIIKEGRPPEKKVYRGNCRYCETVIEFERIEATYRSDNRDGDYLEIQCPVCGKVITSSIKNWIRNGQE